MGQLFIISGLSGSGKSFLTDLVLKELPFVHRAITVTTRKPRPNEIYGVNYIYLSKHKFEAKIKEQFFIEWASVYENYYGTPFSTLILFLSVYRAVVLVVDVQGAKTLRTQFPNSHSIFIDVENTQVAAERIRSRGNYPGELLQRTAPTHEELNAAEFFDFRVLNRNGDPGSAVGEICKIISQNS